MADKIFETKDLIIPVLAAKGDLPDPCPVRIVISDQYICLYVGPRDWQWDINTGAFIGAGTSICAELDPKDLPTQISVPVSHKENLN